MLWSQVVWLGALERGTSHLLPASKILKIGLLVLILQHETCSRDKWKNIESHWNYYRISYTNEKKSGVFINLVFFLYRKSYSNFNDFWWFSKNLLVFFHSSRLHVSCCKIKTNKSFFKIPDPGESCDAPLYNAPSLIPVRQSVSDRPLRQKYRRNLLKIAGSNTSVRVRLHIWRSYDN